MTLPDLIARVESAPPDMAITRPIVGIENRTAQEVFDIMCDRIRIAARLKQEMQDG